MREFVMFSPLNDQFIPIQELFSSDRSKVLARKPTRTSPCAGEETRGFPPRLKDIGLLARDAPENHNMLRGVVTAPAYLSAFTIATLAAHREIPPSRNQGWNNKARLYGSNDIDHMPPAACALFFWLITFRFCKSVARKCLLSSVVDCPEEFRSTSPESNPDHRCNPGACRETLLFSIFARRMYSSSVGGGPLRSIFRL
jgi:hypothetical protein